MRDNEAGTYLVRRNGDTDERGKKRVDIVRATQSVRNISGNRLETDGKERSGIAVNRGKRRRGQERVKRNCVNEILETEKTRRNAAFKNEGRSVSERGRRKRRHDRKDSCKKR